MKNSDPGFLRCAELYRGKFQRVAVKEVKLFCIFIGADKGRHLYVLLRDQTCIIWATSGSIHLSGFEL